MRTALAHADRYSRGAIWLHWVIAVLVIVNLLIGLLHESLLDGVKGAIPLHKSIGITVLALTLARIAWRLGHRPPPLPASMTGWSRLAAHAAHAGLYALLLALPLTGWIMTSGAKVPRPTSFFGLFDLPLLPVSRALGGAAHESHGLLGWVMLLLVGIHVAAALRHHFMLRDSVLARMIPGLSVRR
ncbi:MAG: cytochrome b [Pseudomonadota bacterium]